MFRAIGRIVTHRLAGWTCAAAAGGLAAALAMTNAQAQRDETFLKGRIAALANRDGGEVKAELAGCRASVRSYAAALAASAPRGAEAPHTTRVKVESGDAAAAELVSNPPAGLDVCARMESADEAVMKTLASR